MTRPRPPRVRVVAVESAAGRKTWDTAEAPETATALAWSASYPSASSPRLSRYGHGVWQEFATKWAIAALKSVMTTFRGSRLWSFGALSEIIGSQGIARVDDWPS